MRTLIFDAGPLITLALNNLLWTLPKLKELYGGQFMIPAGVKEEVIDHPIHTKKYKLEALQILPMVRDRTLELIDRKETDTLSRELLTDMNRLYWAKDHPITIVHKGEIEAIAGVLALDAEALVVDERNTRYLIETPKRLQRRLQRKLHTKVSIDMKLLRKISQRIGHIKVLRTAEIASVAYEHGLFDLYMDKNMHNARHEVLEGVLWGIKLNGCAITSDEIDSLLKIERA
jgi:predicted nucleic acid-binding protein